MMTAAEFRLIRETTGLSQEWLARHLNVARRTIAAWEKGEYEIPEGVEGEIHDLVDDFDAAIESMAAKAKTLGEARAVLLVPRFDDESPDHYPAMWHRMVAARVMEKLPVKVEYLPRS